MSIADKLKTIAENVPNVYERGRENGYNEGANVGYSAGYEIGYDVGYEAGKAKGGGLFTYASRPRQLFYEVDFGGQDEIEIEMPNISNADISEMFAKAKGYNRLTAIFAPGVAYNGYRFIQGLSTGGSSIEELTMIDGMKFSRFDGFAQYCINLTTINGRIDFCTGRKIASSGITFEKNGISRKRFANAPTTAMVIVPDKVAKRTPLRSLRL